MVIALACRALPDGQRTLGVMLGSGVAVALRVVFTVLVVELLGLPFVKAGVNRNVAKIGRA